MGMKTNKLKGYCEEMAPILPFISVQDALSYIGYLDEGNSEAAKEVLLDRVGYINAVFADFLAKFDKNQ